MQAVTIASTRRDDPRLAASLSIRLVSDIFVALLSQITDQVGQILAVHHQSLSLDRAYNRLIAGQFPTSVFGELRSPPAAIANTLRFLMPLIRMPSEEQITSALSRVQDPELMHPLHDLGMLREVKVDRGLATVAVALTTDHYPFPDELTTAIEAELRPLPGIKQVQVDYSVMDDSDRDYVVRQLGHEPGEGKIRESIFATGKSNARVLAIASGKGGVGKSTITTNLAVALAQTGAKVGVLDADVWGFSIPRMVGVDRPPNVIGSMVVPPVAYGVRTVSMGFFVDEDKPVIWRGPMLHKAMEQFLVDVYWGDIEYLLIDMPPGTGDIALSMSQFLPTGEVIVVTTPQLAAQRVAQRAGAMATKVGQSVLGVIENMSWFELPNGERSHIFGEGGGQRLAEKLEVPLLGQIPLEENLRIGSDDGHPSVIGDPNSQSAQKFYEIAALIAATGRKKIRRPQLKITAV